MNSSKSLPIGKIALALSIGLHGLLLGLPLPQRHALVESSESEELEAVAIRPTVPPIASPQPPVSPSPPAAPAPAPAAAPKPVPQPVQRSQRAAVSRSPQPQPAIVRPAPVPSPLPSPTATPVTVTPSPAVSPTPEISPSPSPSPSPQPFAADFPHFENAEAGCYGLNTCHQVVGETSFREVGRSMMAQLEAEGYTVRLRDDLADDTGRKVYEVSKSGETQFLTVLSALDLGRTVYVLAEQPMTLAELQSARTTEAPPG